MLAQLSLTLELFDSAMKMQNNGAPALSPASFELPMMCAEVISLMTTCMASTRYTTSVSERFACSTAEQRPGSHLSASSGRSALLLFETLCHSLFRNTHRTLHIFTFAAIADNRRSAGLSIR